MTTSDTQISMAQTKPLLWIFAVLGLTGVLGFVTLIVFKQYDRAWQTYLVNFLFWSAIAQGGLLFSTIMHVVKAKWSRPLQNIAEAMTAFFPISFLLFLGLFIGKEHLFPWIGHDLHGKEVWLNIPFLFTRDTIGLLILYGLGCAYAVLSLKSRIRRDVEAGLLRGMLTCLVGGPPKDARKHKERMTALAIAYMMAYAAVLTLLSVDLVMSMDPHFVSTLFGGYFFIKAFYIGMGGLIIIASLIYLNFEENSLLDIAQFHDIGKLFFAFCIVWAYFLYAQVLVIWYGNVPEETHYLTQRFQFASWRFILIFTFFASFIIPFFTLISEHTKKKPAFMLVLCTVVLTGIWLENLLLVGPPLQFNTASLPLRIFDVLMSLGFLGLMALTVIGVLGAFPELFLKSDQKAN